MIEIQTTPDVTESSVSGCTPAICIGMPVYNGAEYLREALDSLLVQTFTDFELVISDNASTDDTQTICEEYQQRDPRVRYIRQSKNGGAVANFKLVLDCANAELFMWAAYDDLWSPNYLMDTINLLADKSIDFVFPTFELRSIRMGVAKRFDPAIFRFIESPDRRQRVLNFIALHYLSHSANIVYSLFRTDFLRVAWGVQDIGNDGVLGAIVLSRGRGVTSNALFSKRYRTIWPGMLPTIAHVVKGWLENRDVFAEARQQIRAAKTRLLGLFPEYKSDIVFVYDRYRPYKHERYYQVCSIPELSLISSDVQLNGTVEKP